MATEKAPSEQRVVLHDIGWATYERLLAENENNSTPRFAYDRGELEIMSPSPEPLERGFEPDSCFYIQNEEEVRGKDRMDPAVDPPPDLVIEIDITSPSLNKLPIYAQMGVPEVWRYDGERMTILVLEDSDYAATTQSVVPGLVMESTLTSLFEKGKSMKRTIWLKSVRGWVRESAEPAG